MKITINATSIELTKDLESFINEKVKLLDKFLDIKKGEKRKTLDEVSVEIKKISDHHEKGKVFKAELQIHLPGKTLYAESTTSNLKLSISEAKEELQREIKRYKLKKISVRRRREREVKKETNLAPQARTYRKGRIRDEGI